jgi:hypothetical protein
MLRRILAILFIFLCTTGAWLFLGATIMARTYDSEPDLRSKVASSWGSAEVQAQPTLTSSVPMSIDTTKVDAFLDLDYRQKGLLWYSTYKVSFAGGYGVRNGTGSDREVSLKWAFPAQKALYDDVSFTLNGEPVPVVSENGKAVVTAVVPAGKSAEFGVAYQSHGLDSWTYSLGGDSAQVRNFKLRLTTNFRDIDFPDNALSPTSKTETANGWRLGWDYSNLVSGYQIAIALPAKLQPGPLAGEISSFAPVSLFFFFFTMLMITTLRRVELHPLNYFFLAAAFFAFHLLLAYLVDHISIHAAFLIASVVSTALVVSYLRLVTGLRFAVREAGLAQFVFLVLFSYAFFFRGFTGLAITIGAILTLFVSMQLTGRIRWAEHLSVLEAGSPDGRR